MPIVQVSLDVPEDIYLNVLDGSLELLGMVKDGSHKACFVICSEINI